MRNPAPRDKPRSEDECNGKGDHCAGERRKCVCKAHAPWGDGRNLQVHNRAHVLADNKRKRWVRHARIDEVHGEQAHVNERDIGNPVHRTIARNHPKDGKIQANGDNRIENRVHPELLESFYFSCVQRNHGSMHTYASLVNVKKICSSDAASLRTSLRLSP